MKILMFNYEYPPLGGGGGVAHQFIAEELSKRHSVTIVTSGGEGLPSFEVVGGVDVHRVKVLGRKSRSTASLVSMLSYFPASLRTGQKLIEEFHPDLINSHFAIPTGPSAVRLARRNRIPHVLSIHGGDIFDPSKFLSPHRFPILRSEVRRVLNGVDRVVAQSKNTADNARRIYGYQQDIPIIPLGVKRPVLTQCSRKQLGFSENQVVLVCVGRLVKRKANHQLVELVSRLNNPNVVLVVLGEGPEREKLLAQARQLQIEDRVFLPGFVDEELKYQYLQTADLYVSTTSHEGFGLMFIEAMFCGLPIVTYDHGGQCDFLQNGKTGFLVQLNDQSSFQRCVERLINDAMLRKSTGQHNLELSYQFSTAQCASHYEQVFRGLISAASCRGDEK